ncbi:hypothetical protein B0T14DRAFT_561342 [Immersiella caudata]|uniref:Uncharacterized protein n=1 Tax=Immersiella caudata TaxID=314043 RepID=A0AA39XGY7_9PEZI|nr:hypothetical protein B0T14DRAFT_561342 [Immersiella caudata]
MDCSMIVVDLGYTGDGQAGRAFIFTVWIDFGKGRKLETRLADWTWKSHKTGCAGVDDHIRNEALGECYSEDSETGWFLPGSICSPFERIPWESVYIPHIINRRGAVFLPSLSAITATRPERAKPALPFMKISPSHQSGITSVALRDTGILRFLNLTLEHGDRGNESWNLTGLNDDKEMAMLEKLLATFSPGILANPAPEVRGITISETGEVLDTTDNERVVPFGQSYFPSVAESSFPSPQPEFPVVPQSRLTVLKRMAHGIGKVSYTDPSSGKRNW